MGKYYLGIDVGSVSTNIVLMDKNNQNIIYEKLYIRTNGHPLECVGKGFAGLKQKGYSDKDILGVGITGSARTFIGKVIGADVVKNEITTHAVAAVSEHPEVKTVFEIGGQDSKIIVIRQNVVADFAMNTLCAAGTGSFLDQQSFRLNIPIEEFGNYAVKAKNSVRIAGRCAVFAESDMIHKQQSGAAKEELIAGLCEALVRNYLNNVAKGKKIEEPVLFQGGVANNIGIIAAFEKELGIKLIIPKNFDVMGAIGSAIMAKENHEYNRIETIFRGFDIMEQEPKVTKKSCTDCSNECEMNEVSIMGAIMSRWGDRCGKWQAE